MPSLDFYSEYEKSRCFHDFFLILSAWVPSLCNTPQFGWLNHMFSLVGTWILGMYTCNYLKTSYTQYVKGSILSQLISSMQPAVSTTHKLQQSIHTWLLPLGAAHFKFIKIFYCNTRYNVHDCVCVCVVLQHHILAIPVMPGQGWSKHGSQHWWDVCHQEQHGLAEDWHLLQGSWGAHVSAMLS